MKGWHRRHRTRNKLPRTKRQREQAGGRAGRAKGRRAEDLVHEAFLVLVAEGSIKACEKSNRLDYMDAHQVDEQFWDANEERVGLQVKASNGGMREHDEHHPGVPCVSTQGHSLETMVEHLRRKFRLPTPPERV